MGGQLGEDLAQVENGFEEGDKWIKRPRGGGGGRLGLDLYGVVGYVKLAGLEPACGFGSSRFSANRFSRLLSHSKHPHG